MNNLRDRQIHTHTHTHTQACTHTHAVLSSFLCH
uniref:Uncharacterized protein n=1 Tax=Anguilla anguilla TaxID=7936 RepID=A0A0E9T316_ANGAN